MDTPAAELDIDEALVRTLLREQHPDLADLDLKLVANGWDNAIVRLGSDLAVRMPRRQVAAVLVEHEQRWLPEVAARVSVAVPAPVRVGVPSELYPWHWSVQPWFEGELACRSDWAAVRPIAPELAEFVRQLHVAAPADAPANPFRGVPLATRAEVLEQRLASGAVDRPDELRAIWQSALDAPTWSQPPVWLHGDLHSANILLDENHLAAVIDFGDICSGDPASDLATAWLTFDLAGRKAFREALDYDEATWTRAAGWAVLLGSAFVTNSADNPQMHAIGAHGLQQVLL